MSADAVLPEDFVNRELAWWGIPGVAVGMVRADRQGRGTTAARGYGKRNLERGLPMTADSLGGIASCSKAFTTAVAAALVDEGVLDFDTPIRTWLPDFRLMDEFATRECTLRDIFCHRTGIAGHDAMWPQPGMTREEFYQRARFLRPNRPFRSVPQYSNTMYDLAGCILEKITGEMYEDLVRSRILTPLGMTRTCLSLRQMQADPDWAAGYFGEKIGPAAEDAGRSWSAAATNSTISSLRRMEGWEMSRIGNPAAGVNSCVTDMLKWVTLHLTDGVFEGRRVFSEKVMQQMHTPITNMSAFPWRFPEVPGFGLYGMAWKTAVYRGMVMVYHCGEIEGYSSITMFLPSQGLGMFVMCNRHTMCTPFLLELVYTAIDKACCFPVIDWAERLHPYAHDFTGSCADWRMDLTAGRTERAADAARMANKPNDQDGADYMDYADYADYAGAYENPAYGTLVITYGEPEGPIGVKYMKDGREPSPVSLYLHFKEWILPLEIPADSRAERNAGPLRRTTFLIQNLKEDTLFCRTQLSFQTDHSGITTGFSINLDKELPPEIFRRR